MRCGRSRSNRRPTGAEESPPSCNIGASRSIANAAADDNLRCVRRRAFVVTTDSRHHLPVYPNLAGHIAPTAINQLWVADITYIRLRTEFVSFAVVLDVFSRRVIDWALGANAGSRTGSQRAADGIV